LASTVLAQARNDVSPERRAEARQHFANAMRKFDVAKFDDAAAEFVAAYEIMGDPGMLYNIAQAYRLGERSEKALFFYKAFQRHILSNPKTTPALKAEVERRITELTQAIAKSKQAATAPPTGTMNPGQAGHDDMAESSKPPQNGQAEEPHEQSVSPQEQQQQQGTPPKTGTTTERIATKKKVSTTPSNNQATLKYAGIGLGAFAIASVAVGAGLSGAAAKDSSNLQQASQQHAAFGPNLQASEHNGKLYDTVSFVFYGLAGAAAVASAVTLYFGLRPQRAARAQVAPSFSSNSAGLVVMGRF
jgi:hypothetical protein